MKVISFFIDFLHILFILSPIIIFLIPMKYFFIKKIIILLLFLTPSHWIIFNNKCLLTEFSQKLGGLDNTNTNSAFTEKYLKPFYEYFFKLLNIKNNSQNISKFVSVQWFINYMIIFYYIFYYLERKKCSNIL